LTPAALDKEIAELERQIASLKQMAEEHELDVGLELRKLEAKLERRRRESYQNLTAVERVQLARHPKRPFTLDYIQRIFGDFIELHGDRAFRDDEAIVGGWARLGGESIMLIGHQKGRDMKENLRRNFGMPPGRVPEGTPADAPGREVRPARGDAHRHARRLPWDRR
jgi:acetyl-CoA carboxylase carboxyl transferase subunit alpha